MEPNRIPFKDLLSAARDKGDYSTDDTIAFVLPLFKKVLGLHEEGLVAPFANDDALFITDGVVDIDTSLAHAPSNALYRVQALPPPEPYLAGYRCFEHDLRHHDPQTDIFCLGLILASVALGLDLYDPEDGHRLSQLRADPTRHNPRIHPSVGRLITEMTEPDRARRSQDLYDVIGRLEHYRDYDPEKQTDLSGIAGWLDRDLKERDAYILNRLRNRLFDTSRRNRLLYYKPNARFVNLTVSSVPMVLHDRSIRPDLLFTWTPELSEKIIGEKEIVLNKYLRFEDHPYLPSSLDRVRIDAQHDVQEYGFSQLKLVIAFLEWHNLKEDPQERVCSPLLLVPVNLKKNKKVKEDHYVLQVSDNAAEVNPVLAGQLRELHGIRLPDFIDLEEMGPEDLYRLVKAQIEEANQGIALRYAGKPRIRSLQDEAARIIEKHGGKPVRQEFAEGVADTPVTAAGNPAAASNPYDWDFDVCNMVLGNFHYKKMSLVRDYNLVIDWRLQHPVFDSLFSTRPRIFPEHPFDGNRPDDWFHVVSADPTQTRAVLQSRAGYSYIIQGPPGTGKSQTITNLIADFVARGKSILFVCEKRAALDVVYHRLKQVGLEELCCYIHDSREDKREFIRNLKATYEDFIGRRMDLAGLKERRENLLRTMNRQLELMREFHDTAVSEEKDSGISVRELLERIIALREELPVLDPREEEGLPSYGEWKTAAPVLTELATVMEETGAGAVFSDHPFSLVQEAIFLSDSPQRSLDTVLHEALQAIGEVETLLASCRLEPRHLQDANRLKELVQLAVLLYPLARTGNMALADPDTVESREFEKQFLLYQQQQEQHRQAIQKNIHWQYKLSEQDLDAALLLAGKREGSFFGLLNGAYRKLKRRLRESYDLSAHAVAPSWYSILKTLRSEYAAAAQADQTRERLQDRWHLGPNIDTARLGIEMLQARKDHPELAWLLQHPDGPAITASLQALHQPLNQLETLLKRCLQHPPAGPLTAINDQLLNIRLNADGLADWLPALRNFTRLSERFRTTIRHLPLRMEQVEAAIARKTLHQLYQTHRAYAGIDGAVLEKAVHQLGEGYATLQEINAQLIRAYVRQRFLHQMELSNRAAAQLNEEQKKFKKTYAEGRRILENEFGKNMRFKSIRELSEKESGLVLKALKPVWLMSPYSVSDSLPLDRDHFDVVIFDEASQITLEEGVPALYRSQQTIIVGDEKQMPPTDFFGSRSDDPEDLDKMGETDESDSLTIDADSLLAQGARKLESTLLSWHYRSHSETLISFSNYAFYEGGLLTIPDKAIHHREGAPIRIAGPQDAQGGVDSLLGRSISFHLLTDSIYQRRTNPAEAVYIAHIVRQLLRRGVRESIGIVAFSLEQQHAIQDALDGLAAEDAEFARQLEEAYDRMENDQFTGLIIKNLENIQGDERDIILISVCYGPDSRRRMVMNFGPVNKKGGEKRLNVLFSRARKHMAVISSIRYEQITNEYNEGANYLRRFLQYAEQVSEGRMPAARSVLDGFVDHRRSGTHPISTNLIGQQLKDHLVAMGYEVDGPVGQSDFKCSLAVKRTGEDREYALAILLDDEDHYRNENRIEQYYLRPAILRHFGWKVLPVYAKDWLHQPQKVIEQIMRALGAEVPGTTSAPDTNLGPPAWTHLRFRRLVHPARGDFWEAATDGDQLILRWGKNGTRGQTRLQTFADAGSAEAALDRLEKEQREKGYDPR